VLLLTFLFALTLVFLATARHYPAEARIFPMAVSSVMLGLLGLELVSRRESDWSRRLRKHLNPAGESVADAYPRGAQFAAIAWVAASAALFWLAGILAAVALYVFASLRFRGRRSYLSSAAIAAGTTLAIWLLFSVALKIELYRGALAGNM
jgi:hypothetical protein